VDLGGLLSLEQRQIIKIAGELEGGGRMTAAVSLHYVVDGAPGGAVVVLGSSLGTTGAMWLPQVKALGATYRVVRYDHRGHGGSPAPDGPYSIEDLGSDLLALLDRLELARVDLAGLSLGGMVAMWLAATAPHRVRRLALLCTSARPDEPDAWRQRAAKVRTRGLGAVVGPVTSRWFTPEFDERHPAVGAWARAMFVANPAEGYAGCCEAIAALDLVPLLGRIEAPTLVVAGARDLALPVPHAERIAAGVPGARLAIVDAAHLANVEQPVAVTDLLTDFYTGGAPQ
jgi:3-oxoadipate enol-lactonase